MAWFQVYYSYHVIEVSHLPGVEMGFIDDVSRGRNNPLCSVVPFVKVEGPDTLELFRCCDPTGAQPVIDNMEAFFRISRLLKGITE